MFSRKEKKEKIRYEEDDGRSYADMNVPGLPWYRPEQKTDGKKDDKPELSDEGYRSFIWGALKAALLVGVVFVLAYFFFILFLDKVVFGN